MMYEHILAEEKDGVATVTLNRPEQLNAWTWRMALEIRHAIAGYDARDDVRAIVVTGAGRAFCAGADLSGPRGGAAAEAEAALREQVARDLRPASDAEYWTMATPLIAAMNGSATGIGMTLPMQFDLRIMAENAKYGFVFNRRGFVPELGSTWIVPRLIGTAKAMDLLLTGRIFSGTEGAALGLASEARPADQVLERAHEIARDIADNVAPVSAAVTKRMIYRNLAQDDRAEAVEREGALFSWSTQQEDGREGVAAFLGKRAPEWKMSKSADFPRDLFGG
jgi:enoyl-CoA hydratase/carnithine racemase